jgi:predicted site-specific integrase-resolvase
VSVALAAQLLGVSRTTVEAWKTEGVLVSAQHRLRHEVTMDDDLGELGGALTAPGLLEVYG